MTEAYVGLGSNMGDRVKNIKCALNMLAAIENTTITAISSLYLTPPWGVTGQNEFVNQVIAIDTGLCPSELLRELKKIEIKMGRRSGARWGPRVIDLDILWYGGEKLDLPELQIPHPYLRQRLFVLIPLEELNPELVLPEDGMTVEEVLKQVLGREQIEIRKIK